MKFKKGEKVNVLVGKYKGSNVHIFDIHTLLNPTCYSCKTRDGKELLYHENELQSMYAHDIAMLDKR